MDNGNSMLICESKEKLTAKEDYARARQIQLPCEVSRSHRLGMRLKWAIRLPILK